ncbi:MAG: MoaD/ThiS family protein [Rhodococcus sp.]|nr:MoaD/ThiS family protein [Rhodococcus sp. (in: high G+C Gram-positive bacteria)]
MSVEIRMARGLRVHVEVPECVQVEGATAREAIDALIAAHPALRRFVLDDARRLRQHVNIYINDELIGDREQLSDAIRSGDRVYILPAVSGGAVRGVGMIQGTS